MVKRQPGRPSEVEFTTAAFRFITNEYEFRQVNLIHGYTTSMHNSPIGKYADAAIIRAEWLADGQLGEDESITDFAIRQLAAYQKLHKD